jgi:hypothetical protein
MKTFSASSVNIMALLARKGSITKSYETNNIFQEHIYLFVLKKQAVNL